MLSQKTRYTIRALQHLSDTFGQGPVRLDAIAEAQNIPRKFLTVILSEMAREGIVISHRGREGGDQAQHAQAQRVICARRHPSQPDNQRVARLL